MQGGPEQPDSRRSRVTPVAGEIAHECRMYLPCRLQAPVMVIVFLGSLAEEQSGGLVSKYRGRNQGRFESFLDVRQRAQADSRYSGPNTGD